MGTEQNQALTQAGRNRSRQAWRISHWLAWLAIAYMLAMCLLHHRMASEVFLLAALPWWAYALVSTGLLAYALSLLYAAPLPVTAVLVIFLLAGAASAVVIGIPMAPEPPWYLREAPFSTPPPRVPRHDRYVPDGFEAVLTVHGLYGLLPLALVLAFSFRATVLARRLPPGQRRAIYAAAATGFSLLFIEVGDRVSGDWVDARYYDFLMTREPTALVQALWIVERNPLCRGSCKRRVCQIGLPKRPEDVRKAVEQFCRGDPA